MNSRETFTFPEPVLQNVADPFVLTASDGYYYLYGTGTSASTGGGFRVWRSDNLTDWTAEGLAFSYRRGNWGLSDFWAPEVLEYNNRYYMFYTARDRETGRLNIGVATSDSPMGPFEDERNEPILNFGYAAIDASPFVDEDGRIYMYYARDVSENIISADLRRSDIYVVELNSEMEVISEPTLLFYPTQAWETQFVQEGWVWNEGPSVIRVDDLYYMTYSGNPYYAFEYAIGLAVADSPVGEFVKDENNPIVQGDKAQRVSGPGHNSIFKSHDGQVTYIAYHTHINFEQGGGEREVRISEVVFENGQMRLVN